MASAGGSGGRPQRADARRNIAAILDAAVLCLAEDPDASLGDIAQAAGVGRVTLYGHFKSRADLVDAVLTRTMAEADEILDRVDTTGDPSAALTRLVEASWQIVHQFRAVHRAAGRELPAERLHGSHDRVRRRIQSIVERGRRSGTFRGDLPAKWLTTTVVGLMHAAAEESAAGRLAAGDAPRLISATVLAALTAPDESSGASSG
ncbi:TetR/AcrR family transcriptional regulator [Dactylosporangium darangshiense]|uniref:TetR/AcrR family transcriptional regulator n=1 Tax=Dactylosporangium darangshiense TaxID=579108 RepID=A0ABP8DHB3_9ACTN